MDKTLNDAFGDDDEEVQQHQKKPKVDSRTAALKDKLKEMKIGVVSVNEDEKKREDVKPKQSGMNKPKDIQIETPVNNIIKKVQSIEDHVDHEEDDEDDEEMIAMP